MTELTVKEFAEEMRCSCKTVYRTLKDGRLAFRRNGNRYLIPKTEVDRLKTYSVGSTFKSKPSTTNGVYVPRT